MCNILLDVRHSLSKCQVMPTSEESEGSVNRWLTPGDNLCADMKKTRLRQVPALTWKQACELLPMAWLNIEVDEDLYSVLEAEAKKKGQSVFGSALQMLENEITQQSQGSAELSLPDESHPPGAYPRRHL